MDKSSLLFCYSKNLSDHLRQYGFQPLTLAKNAKTDQLFSLFYRSPELLKALDDYNARINNKREREYEKVIKS
ncbi:DUF5659 domain-containing protein [Halobacillus sp. A5]|uniref:DUF5659 domain-containing protein n=1 Tax=Halobacillus sp. A5 TaxID=2880263 RepID=UPI0020A6A8DB|nr:DUF5659 domain-containing protein [Halobacillus sp. A5]MCP3026018.1 DUF5659 domain-containing protein [Halobacillus sp. A5]